MDRFKPPNPETQIQKKPPQVVAREEAEKGERDEKLALSIMQAMVELYKGQGLEHEDFLKRCERSWLWTVTDTWPPDKHGSS